MAIVRHLEHVQLQVEAKHTSAEATWSIIKDRDGEKYLQIDTYGSNERKLVGKKSQSIRLSVEATRELKDILRRHF